MKCTFENEETEAFIQIVDPYIHDAITNHLISFCYSVKNVQSVSMTLNGVFTREKLVGYLVNIELTYEYTDKTSYVLLTDIVPIRYKR